MHTMIIYPCTHLCCYPNLMLFLITKRARLRPAGPVETPEAQKAGIARPAAAAGAPAALSRPGGVEAWHLAFPQNEHLSAAAAAEQDAR